jgi:hypothetical protein
MHNRNEYENMIILQIRFILFFFLKKKKRRLDWIVVGGTTAKKVAVCHLQVATCTKLIHVANRLSRVNGHVCAAW